MMSILLKNKKAHSTGTRNSIDYNIERINKIYGKHLSISLTQRCPLRCSHCIVSCQPSNDRSLDITESTIQSIIEGLEALSGEIEQISFTGGEPFLCKEAMIRISLAANKHSINCGVVTSAYWATNINTAIKTLDKIRYLSHLTISYDLYHAEYIDKDRIRNAVVAAEELGRSVSIRVSIPPNPNKEHKGFLSRLKFEFGKRVHTQEVISFGRATDLEIKPNMVKTVPILPCLSSGPHVTENGNVTPCCSALDNKLPYDHPLNLGDTTKTSLAGVYKNSDHNVILNFIRLWGFPMIMSALEQEFPKKYSSMSFSEEGQCSLCATIMNDVETVKFLKHWSKSLNIQLNSAIGAAKHFKKTDVLKEVIKKRRLEITS